MRVAYDDQVFTWQRRGGISRYVIELTDALSADPALGVEVLLPRYWSRTELLTQSARGRRTPRVLQRRPVLRNLNRLLRPRGGDLVHPTYYNASDLEPVGGRPMAVTIYDMIPERFPELFPAGNPHLAKRRYVDRADVILCISEACKVSLVEAYGQLAAPVVVTPLGVDSSFRPGAPPYSGAPPAYVLYVGDRPGYKDFDVCLRAFAQSELPNDVKLLCVGGGGWSPSEWARLSALGLARRVVHMDVDDAGLIRLYGNALCFVFASRYEGFGLPSLEAMACGCPTLLADSSSHPEVGGDAAVYFEPSSAESLAELLSRVAADTGLQERLRKAGLARAAKFSWARTASLTAGAYDLALK